MNLKLLKSMVESHLQPPRKETFLQTLEFAVERNVNHIVETGTIRRDDLADGCSTLTWAMYTKIKRARDPRAMAFSVDISQEAIDTCVKRLGEFKSQIIFAQQDSVTFLSRHQTEIDLLYLDSYDYEEKNPLPSQIHQLAELGAAYGKLSARAIVLMDDCNIPGGGKGLLSAQFLLERKWRLVADKYQKLFVRELV